jgi:hypothetical protein
LTFGTLLPAKDSGMPHVENDRIVESTNEARAAVTGQNVNYVLLISNSRGYCSLSGGLFRNQQLSGALQRPPSTDAAPARDALECRYEHESHTCH